jgi:hypothetical protein
MKRKLIFKYGVIFCLAICFGCSKDSTDDSNYSLMQAKVDGIMKVCDKSVSLRKDLGGSLWGVEGYSKEGVHFLFQFPISNGSGTYHFLGWNGDFQNEGWVMYNVNGEQFKSTGGSIIITKAISHRFEGTFSFPSESYEGNTRNITEGEFVIAY